MVEADLGEGRSKQLLWSNQQPPRHGRQPQHEQQQQQRPHRRSTTRSSWMRTENRQSKTTLASSGEGREVQAGSSSLDDASGVKDPRRNNSEPSVGSSDMSSQPQRRRRSSRARRNKELEERHEEQVGQVSKFESRRNPDASGTESLSTSIDTKERELQQGGLHSFLQEEEQTLFRGGKEGCDASSGSSTIRHDNKGWLSVGESSNKNEHDFKIASRPSIPGSAAASSSRNQSIGGSVQKKDGVTDPLEDLSCGSRPAVAALGQGSSSDDECSQRSRATSVDATHTSMPSLASACSSSSSASFAESSWSESVDEASGGRNARLWKKVSSSLSLSSNADLPSLSSYSTSNSTEDEFASISGSSASPRNTKGGSAASMPSLASLSLSDITSSSSLASSALRKGGKVAIPKVHVIPEEPNESASSFLSLTLDVDVQQPMSELTMACSASRFSEDGSTNSFLNMQQEAAPSSRKLVERSHTSSSDSTKEDQMTIERNYSTTSSSMGVSLSENNDSKTSFSNSHSSLPKGRRIIASSLHNSNRTLSPGDSRHSYKSLLGQHFISSPDLDASQDLKSFVDSGSMAYSETSEKSGASSRAGQRSRIFEGGPAASFTLPESPSRRSHKKPKPAPYDGALLLLVESMHGTGSTVEHFNDSLSSFQTFGYDSRRSFASGSSASKHSRSSSPVGVPRSPYQKSGKGGLDTTKESGRHVLASVPGNRASGYVSSGSSASSNANEDALSNQVDSASNAMQVLQRTVGSRSSPVSGHKALRRQTTNGSLSSAGSELSPGERHVVRPPHKQPRRHSVGSPIPSRVDTSPKQRESAGSAGSSSKHSPRPNEPTPKHRNSINHQVTEKMERGDTGYFSAASSTSSRSTASSFDIEQAKEMIEKSYAKSSVTFHPGNRSASPLASTRKLRTEDLERMRYSAPPRLGRIRSPHRRMIHILHHFEHDRSQRSAQSNNRMSLSQRSQRSTSVRGETYKVVDRLSVDNLDNFPANGSSLPPRLPGSPSIKSLQGGQPSADPRAKTIRRGNRTVDLLSGIAEIKQGRRRSWTSSASERRYRIVGLPPFVEDNEDDSVSSGSSSDMSQDDPYLQPVLNASQKSYGDSVGRMSWKFDNSESSHMTMRSAGMNTSPLPPRHRHRPSLKPVPSDHSMSSISHMTGESSQTHSHSSMAIADLEPLTRIDRAFSIKADKEGLDSDPAQDQSNVSTFARVNSLFSATSGVSNTTYDLQPVHLRIPSSHSPSTHPSSSTTTVSIARITSMVSATSGISNLSYDLQPFHLPIPTSHSPSTQPSSTTSGSMPNTSHANESRCGPQLPLAPPVYRIDSRASAKTASSEVTCEIPAFPQHGSELGDDSSVISASSSDSSFARHAKSAGIDCCTPQQNRQETRRAVAISPPNSPLSFDAPCFIAGAPSEVVTNAAMSRLASAPPSPGSQAIWEKLRLEKERQEKLRKKLHMAPTYS